MSRRVQLFNKRKSTSNHNETNEFSPRIDQDDYPASSSDDEEEEVQSRSRKSQGRNATSATTILAQVMRANQKKPTPPAAAPAPALVPAPATAAAAAAAAVVAASSRAVSTTASPGSSSRARTVQSPQVLAARTIITGQGNHLLSIQNHASPPVVAQMPVATLQAMQPPLPIQDAGHGQSPTAHSVAAIQANQGDFLDDASSLSVTENGNIKAMRMLHQYFVSLAASGTVRSIIEERNMITDKLGLIYRKVKFINADTDLNSDGDIAKVLFKEMKIPDAYKIIWWEQMKGHVRKKWMKEDQTLEQPLKNLS